MSARGDNCPVQVLRSPVPRPGEPPAVDFGLDEATMPSAIPVVPRSLRSFSLPPSPPYTDSHLRRAIPLPGFDEVACKERRNLMEIEQDEGRHTSSTFHTPANLLSPPYSPHRRALSLTSVYEKEEEFLPLSSADTSSDESDEHGWGECDDNCDVSEPPILKLRDLDLGEESDDWDEPLYLNVQSLRTSDSLALNLFGAIYSSDDERSSYRSIIPPSSPAIHSSSLPEFDGDSPEKSKPLFDPSDFDVFENGWDTITTVSVSSEQDTTFGLSDDHSAKFHDAVECSFLSTPSSPSGRSVIDLPADGDSDSLASEPAVSANPLITNEKDHLSRRDDQLSGHSRSYRNTLHRSHKQQQVSDVSAELIQTPFNVPFLLPSSTSRSPPADSLLFTALEPQDIPLPDSPESPVLSLEGDYRIPPFFLEEYRIRQLHQEMLTMEAEARAREACFTDYIARLSVMEPPTLPVPVPVYNPKPQTEAAANEEPDNAQPLHLEEQRASLCISPTWTQSSSASQAAATFEFLQYRRKELQNASALRAAERRRRKLTKERVRELEALLQLKVGQFRSTDGWALCASRGRRGRNDEPTVLYATGSNRHSTSTDTTPFEVREPETSQKGGIMHLVAKMVLRRRDTSRPLSGRTIPVAREYVRSRLSQTLSLDGDDDEEVSNDIGNAQVS